MRWVSIIDPWYYPIRINSIHPGYTDTNLVRKALATLGDAAEEAAGRDRGCNPGRQARLSAGDCAADPVSGERRRVLHVWQRAYRRMAATSRPETGAEFFPEALNLLPRPRVEGPKSVDGGAHFSKGEDQHDQVHHVHPGFPPPPFSGSWRSARFRAPMPASCPTAMAAQCARAPAPAWFSSSTARAPTRTPPRRTARSYGKCSQTAQVKPGRPIAIDNKKKSNR